MRAPADAAFIQAMHVTAGIAAGITLVGVAVCLRWLPGRQLQVGPQGIAPR